MELKDIDNRGKTGTDRVDTEIQTTGRPASVNLREETCKTQKKRNPLYAVCNKFGIFLKQHRERLVILGKGFLGLGYIAYFISALTYHFGDEGSIRLLVCSLLASWIIGYKVFKLTKTYEKWMNLVHTVYDEYCKGKRSLFVRWFLYVAMALFMAIYVIVFVAMKSSGNLRSLLGLFIFPMLLFLGSNNRRLINWHTIYWAMAFQFIMALLILKTSWGALIIRWCGERLKEFVANGEAGSVFIFGEKYTDHMFAFGGMAKVFTFIVGMSVLNYLGVIKYIVETFGRAMAFMLGTSPPEGINAIGNIFLHIPESAILVQEYLHEMTPSQLFVTYAGGLSTVGGVSLIIFMESGGMAKVFTFIVGMSVLNYLGVIKYIVETFGRAMAFMLGTSPPEGINAIGNIFLHIPESAILVQEYLHEMTPSQLFVTYAGGLSTVGGVSLIIFMESGVPAAPLVAASAMSAPAALAASKLAFPSYDDEEVPKPGDEEKHDHGEKANFLRHPRSMMDAIFVGISQSVAVVVQAIAFIMTFVIILSFVNRTLVWFGERVGVQDMTIEYIFSYVFYPMAFIMGARSEDCLFIGEVLGIRTFSLAIVAYPKLGPIIQNGMIYRQYITESVNNTWSKIGNDIFLDNLNQTLVGGIMDEKSELIATYALCGSASFAVSGYIIGSFKVIIPQRIGEITKHMPRALVVGTVASYLTACFAGLLFEEGI